MACYLASPVDPRIVRFAPRTDGTVEITTQTYTFSYGTQTHRKVTDATSARRLYRRYVGEGWTKRDSWFR